MSSNESALCFTRISNLPRKYDSYLFPRHGCSLASFILFVYTERTSGNRTNFIFPSPSLPVRFIHSHRYLSFQKGRDWIDKPTRKKEKHRDSGGERINYLTRCTFKLRGIVPHCTPGCISEYEFVYAILFSVLR